LLHNQLNPNGQSNQKWKQEARSSGGRIWSFARNSSNQVLCIQYQSLTDQYGLNVVPYNSSQNQKWYADLGITNESIPTNATPTYKTIKSFTNSGFGFNIYGGVNNDQAPVKVWNLSGAWNELYTLLPSGEIKNIQGKCVDAGNIADPNNRTLRIHECHGQSNQKWYFDSSARLRSYANTSLCVDSQQGNVAGSILYMYTCHTGYNQQWSMN
jgi:Ricin-type beta-trefoil lectin domain